MSRFCWFSMAGLPPKVELRRSRVWANSATSSSPPTAPPAVQEGIAVAAYPGPARQLPPEQLNSVLSAKFLISMPL